MAIIDVTINDRAVRAALMRGAAAVSAALDIAIDKGLNGVIEEIKANDDRLFRHPSGVLTSGLHIIEHSNGGKASAGWTGPSAVYGPVLESGPRDRGPKPILPKGTLVKGFSKTGASGRAKRNAGEPIKALRFKVGGEVIYRRKSTYRWDPSMARPHWSWAFGRRRDWIHATIRKQVIDAVKEGMRGR
jgi:hypothetical protein